MRKKLIRHLALVGIFFGVTLGLVKANAITDGNNVESYSYFSYAPLDIDSLKPLSSCCQITEEMLKAEDTYVDNFLIWKEASFLEKLRLRTYLYAGQREMSFLSFATKHHFEGDLHFLTEKILSLFYPDYEIESFPQDAYTQKLTELVFKHLSKRFKEEKKILEAYPTQQWIPWVAKPTIQFFPSSYDRNELLNQIKMVLLIQKKATPLEKEQALYWEGGCGSDSGDWISVGNKFVFDDEKNLPIGKMILIRNLLAITLYDTEIAVYAAKERFNIERPFEVDTKIIPLGPKPHSSSFPSGHASLAGASLTILSYFFPEAKDELQKISQEASQSRIVAGVHTYIDLEEGEKMGKKIASEVLLNEWGVKEKQAAQSKSKVNGKYIKLIGGRYTSRPNCCFSRKIIWNFIP